MVYVPCAPYTNPSQLWVGHLSDLHPDGALCCDVCLCFCTYLSLLLINSNAAWYLLMIVIGVAQRCLVATHDCYWCGC